MLTLKHDHLRMLYSTAYTNVLGRTWYFGVHHDFLNFNELSTILFVCQNRMSICEDGSYTYLHKYQKQLYSIALFLKIFWQVTV